MLTPATPGLGAIDQVMAWWEGHRQGQGIPMREILGLADLRTALPDLFLVDAEADAATGRRLYRCLLTGTAVDHMLGVNLTTPCAPDFPLPFEVQAIAGEFDKAAFLRKPVRGNRCLERPNDRHFEYEWAIAPLAGEASINIALLIGAIEFKCIFDLPGGRPPGCPGREACRNMALRDLPAGCGLRF